MQQIEIQKLLKIGRVVLIILGVFIAVEALGAIKTWRQVEPAYNVISVVGQGEAVSVPDIATFSFSVSADAKSVGDAQDTVTKKIDAIDADLKGMGIDEKDINTTDYSVYPKYVYQQSVCTLNSCPPSRQIADGYTVSHTISVKVRKTADAGKALSVVGGKGATNVSGLNFTTDDPNKITNEAKNKAILDARSKAETLAKSLGVKLVRVTGYNDSSYGGGPVFYAAEAVGGMDSKATTPAPTIPVGQNKVTANVTVTYEIR